MIGTEIEKARELLLQNEVVAIPTETVYGLAGNALSSVAVSKIFEAKNRPHFDPLIVHVSLISEVSKYVEEIPELTFKLMEHFWPGPLTVLLPKKSCIPDLTTSGLNEVGIRIPNHATTLELLKSLPFPLAAPSANPFGYISPTSAQHVEDQLGEKIPYILNYNRAQQNNTAQSFLKEKGIVSDALSFLSEKRAALQALGCTDVIIDPGFGFGKSLAENHELLQKLEHLHLLGAPLLVGVSRKSMITKVLNCSADEALNGTSILNTLAYTKGARLFRVHDVAAAKELILLLAVQDLH